MGDLGDNWTYQSNQIGASGSSRFSALRSVDPGTPYLLATAATGISSARSWRIAVGCSPVRRLGRPTSLPFALAASGPCPGPAADALALLAGHVGHLLARMLPVRASGESGTGVQELGPLVLVAGQGPEADAAALQAVDRTHRLQVARPSRSTEATTRTSPRASCWSKACHWVRELADVAPETATSAYNCQHFRHWRKTGVFRQMSVNVGLNAPCRGPLTWPPPAWPPPVRFARPRPSHSMMAPTRRSNRCLQPRCSVAPLYRSGRAGKRPLP